jgi:AcrR family transcriptional regulator
MVSGVLDATLINSKDAILDAAEMLMARVGYDKASISQICRESKLPVGSIYHHFGSKAGLLSAVIERGVGRFFSALPQPDAGAASAEQAMREYFGAAADAIVENLDFFTLEGDLTRFRRRDPEFARTIATVRERNEQNLTAVIAPLARELGVQNVDDLCQRLVEVTMIFTRGAVMSAGDDLPQLRLLIQDLHTMIRSAILEAAQVDRQNTTSRGRGRNPTV